MDKGGIRIKKCLLVMFFVFMGGFFVLSSGVAYANGGGWTGSGEAIVPSGVAGSTYGSGNCSGDNASYLLGCTGFSWIYYKYVGGVTGRNKSIQFRPYNNKANDGFISGECAGNEKGFWHFGRNAKGFSYGGFASYNYLYGYSDNNYVYSTVSGKWGHMESYTYGTYVNYANYYNWSGVPGGSAYYIPSGGVNQILYRKSGNAYLKMYEATKLGTVSNVFKDYKTAYEYTNGKKYSGSSLPSSVYAFCYWDDMKEKYTLTGKAIDENGKSLSSAMEDVVSDPVTSGNSASITRRTATGYIFEGWKTAKTSSSYASTLAKYSTTLTANTTVYAVYSLETRTLTAYAVDVNGKKLNGGEKIDSDTVNYGTAATVSNTSFDNYTFLGWKVATANKISGCTNATALAGEYVGTKSSYKVNNLTANGAVCAVYGSDYKFTVKSVNAQGTSLAGVTGLADKVKTVSYGGSSSIKRGTATGYTFMGWKTTATGNYEQDASVTTYRVENVTANIRRYAVYEKNTFLGRARVKNGSSVDDTNSTGWVQSDATKSIELDCPNDGCIVAFDLALKTNSGSGKTTYAVYRNGSAQVVSPASPTAPSSGGTTLKISNKTVYTEKVKPGETVCYHVTFTPDGTSTTTATAKACATAKNSTFEGKSDISGAVSATTDWQRTTARKVAFINNCNSTSGCNVSFSHALRKVSGGGSTNYSVKRTVNYTSSLRAIKTGTADSNSNVKNGAFSLNSGVVSSSGAWTLYPGMVVCEVLTFIPNNLNTTSASTTVCASALGSARPSDPAIPDDPNNPQNDPNGDAESDALIDIQVKNNSVSRYGTYRRTVYAKPGDVLTYRGTYNPKLQYTYYLVPQKLRIDNGAIYDNSSSLLYQIFNKYKSPGWNNDMTIYSSNFLTGTFSQNYSFTNGSISKQTRMNTHTVTKSEVGRSLNETNQTNLNSVSQTTPVQVTFYNSSNYNIGNVVTSSVSATAFARVPYNFINTTEVSAPDTTVLYAGEKVAIRVTTKVNKKRNNETMGEYATIVRNARQKLEVCSSGRCYETNAETRNLNTAGDLSGATETRNMTINVPDAPAGTEVCLRSAVYPASSGADTNLNVAGSNSWQYSERVCFKVAKRPSFQVWGGNVYSNGRIKTAVSVKNNLAGQVDYAINATGSGGYVFGSWGELGVISAGTVTGMASGAGTGRPLGSFEATVNFCLRSTLTFANDNCRSNNAGGLGVTDLGKDKTEIIDLLTEDGNEKIVREKVSSLGSKFISDNRIYYYSNNGNINITGDIRYRDNGYRDLESVPKVIVHAKNIVISCNVNRIDAVLIAEESVKTCSSDNINAEANSNQLYIYGAIIANRLILNRTYGAATGTNSVIPAEIINHDPTLYLWGNVSSEGDRVNEYVTTYMREMAPRL